MKKNATISAIYMERIKYLLSCDYYKLKYEDKMHRILIRIALTPIENNILKNWCISKWDINKTSKLIGRSVEDTKEAISEITTSLESIVWDNRSNPLIINKSSDSNDKWIGDSIINSFLNDDLIIISASEYIELATSDTSLFTKEK